MKYKLVIVLILLLTQTGCAPLIPVIGQIALRVEMLVYGPFRPVPDLLQKFFSWLYH